MKTRTPFVVFPLAIALSTAVLFVLLLALPAPLPAQEFAGLNNSTSWTDQFDGPNLDPRWSWVNEDPSHWSLTDRPGFLRITTKQTFNGLTNLLVLPEPVGDYEMQTRVFFTPVENYQIATIGAYLSDGNGLALGRAFCDVPPPTCLGNAIYFDYFENGVPIGSNYAMTTTVQDEAYLRIVRHSNTYSGFVSLDGNNWTLVGAHMANIDPDKIGLTASNQTQGGSEIPADFDFFGLIDDSQKLFVPMIMN